MTDLYSEWQDFYDEKVRSWMSLEELRAECGKLTTTDGTSPELLLIHAMHELEALQAEVERLRADGASAVRWAPGSAYWSEVLRELFGPDARNGIDALEARWRKEIERADTAEALLRQALEALGRAHQTAMEQTLKARLPECAEFAGIAQDLDFVVTALRERLGVKA